jgi:hypothetical protein
MDITEMSKTKKGTEAKVHQVLGYCSQRNISNQAALVRLALVPGYTLVSLFQVRYFTSARGRVLR